MRGLNLCQWCGHITLAQVRYKTAKASPVSERCREWRSFELSPRYVGLCLAPLVSMSRPHWRITIGLVTCGTRDIQAALTFSYDLATSDVTNNTVKWNRIHNVPRSVLITQQPDFRSDD